MKTYYYANYNPNTDCHGRHNFVFLNLMIGEFERIDFWINFWRWAVGKGIEWTKNLSQPEWFSCFCRLLYFANNIFFFSAPVYGNSYRESYSDKNKNGKRGSTDNWYRWPKSSDGSVYITYYFGNLTKIKTRTFTTGTVQLAWLSVRRNCKNKWECV